MIHYWVYRYRTICGDVTVKMLQQFKSQAKAMCERLLSGLHCLVTQSRRVNVWSMTNCLMENILP